MITLNTKIWKTLFYCLCSQSAVLSFLHATLKHNQWIRVREKPMSVVKVVWNFDKDKWNNAVRFGIVMHRFSEFIQFVGRQWKIAFVHTSVNSKVKVYSMARSIWRTRKNCNLLVRFSFRCNVLYRCQYTHRHIEYSNWCQCMDFNAYPQSHTGHIAIHSGSVFTDFLHAVSLLRRLETKTEHASSIYRCTTHLAFHLVAVVQWRDFFFSLSLSIYFVRFSLLCLQYTSGTWIVLCFCYLWKRQSRFQLVFSSFGTIYTFICMHTYARHDEVRKL